MVGGGIAALFTAVAAGRDRTLALGRDRLARRVPIRHQGTRLVASLDERPMGFFNPIVRSVSRSRNAEANCASLGRLLPRMAAPAQQYISAPNRKKLIKVRPQPAEKSGDVAGDTNPPSRTPGRSRRSSRISPSARRPGPAAPAPAVREKSPGVDTAASVSNGRCGQQNPRENASPKACDFPAPSAPAAPSA